MYQQWRKVGCVSVTGLNFLFDCGWPLKVILQSKQGLTVWFIIVSLVEKIKMVHLYYFFTLPINSQTLFNFKKFKPNQT